MYHRMRRLSTAPRAHNTPARFAATCDSYLFIVSIDAVLAEVGAKANGEEDSNEDDGSDNREAGQLHDDPAMVVRIEAASTSR